MKMLLVINAYTDACLRQACQLRAFLHQNAIREEDAVAVGFGPASREGLLLESLRMFPVKKGIIVRAPFCAVQQMLAWLEENLPRPEVCLFSGDGFGQEMAIRAALRWKGSSLTGVTAFDPVARMAKRSFYAGHLAGWFHLQKPPCVLSIDPGLAEEPLSLAAPPQYAQLRPETVRSRDAESLLVDKNDGKCMQTIQRYEILSGELQEEVVRSSKESQSALQEASRVVICGMGVGNKRNAEEVMALADEISFTVGASRPAVMSAWFPAERLVGVSGAIIAPEVCVLLGVSGAPAFYSGIRHAGKIIAVNQEQAAPIMKKADLAIVGDCMEVFRSFVKHAGITAE